MHHRFIVRGLSGLLVLSLPALAHGAPPDHSARAATTQARINNSHRSKAATAQVNPYQNMVPFFGHVTLPDGAPASHADVLLSWMTNKNEIRFHAIRTDEHGAFAESIHLADKGQKSLGVSALVPGKGIVWNSVADTEHLSGLKLHLDRGTALTGRLVRLNGKPAAGCPIHVRSISPGIKPNAMQDFQFLCIARILEDKQAATVFQAVTDDTGHFTFTGLPRNCSVLFAPGSGLVLTPGSMIPDDLGAAEKQDAGILVATQLGGLKAHIVNSITGKPAVGVPVSITNQHAQSAGIQFMGQRGQPLDMSRFACQRITNANGDVYAQGLMPGDYMVTARGSMVETTVEENRTGEPIRFALRQGSLKGCLLDAHGKPVANVGIAMNPGRINSEQFQLAPFMLTAWENQQVASTDSNGYFEIHDFPWGSSEVIVRATRGNDRAEWRGAAKDIGSTLKLNLTPNALVTVTGRLIDPQRRLITNVTGQALHWTSLPRTTWFGNAHAVQADAQGRFTLAGLERGESFSVVTGGPMMNNVQRFQVERLQESANSSPAANKNFESPRFVTRTTGQQQDLGDVMVHPLEDGGQTQQIYGDESPEDTVRNFNLLPAPTAAMVAEAKGVLARYLGAIQTGDLDTVQRLTSTVSSGWSDQRGRFLRDATIRPSSIPGSIDPAALQSVRFVTRATATTLIAMNSTRNFRGGFASSSATREVDLHPDWVFLTAKQNNEDLLVGVLRREDGAWRVVNDCVGSPFANVEAMVLSNFDSNQPSAKQAVNQPQALTVADRATARQVGEQFLQSWVQDRAETMLALTAAQSPDHAPNLAGYKQRFEQRMDEGLCPLNPGDAVSLQPVEDLTRQEKMRLLDLVQTRGMITPERRIVNARFGRQMQSPQADTLAVYRYQAAGKEMLLLLAHQNEKWQVIEPALPL